jgi:hypothetical protein
VMCLLMTMYCVTRGRNFQRLRTDARAHQVNAFFEGINSGGWSQSSFFGTKVVRILRSKKYCHGGGPELMVFVFCPSQCQEKCFTIS